MNGCQWLCDFASIHFLKQETRGCMRNWIIIFARSSQHNLYISTGIKHKMWLQIFKYLPRYITYGIIVGIKLWINSTVLRSFFGHVIFMLILSIWLVESERNWVAGNKYQTHWMQRKFMKVILIFRWKWWEDLRNINHERNT